MGFIDLHVHSNASDGTVSPSGMVAYAISKGLDATALIDHDTVDGLAETKEAAKGTLLELVPGIEMPCMHKTAEIHVLGLFVEKDSSVLLSGLTDVRRIRNRRNERILQYFQEDGFTITMEDLVTGNPDTIITRAHFAKALTEKGYTSSQGQAFDKYLTYSGCYCIRKEVTMPGQILRILTLLRAFPIIAYPIQYHTRYAQIEDMVARLKEVELQGIEVCHSSHNRHEDGKLREMARRQHLLPSGGSDFHGANKSDIDIGCGRGGLRLSYPLLNDMKEVHNHGRAVSDDWGNNQDIQPYRPRGQGRDLQ